MTDKRPPAAIALVDGRRVWWTSVRRNSALTIAVTVPIVIASAWALTHVAVRGSLKYLLAAPFAMAYIACIAAVAGLVLGRPLAELNTMWNQMPGWRRGILSLVLVVLAIMMLVGLGGVIVTVAA